MKLIIGTGKVSSIIKDEKDICLSHNDIEVRDFSSVLEKLENNGSPLVVINTAAKINLEWCEKNKEEAYQVNVEGALNIARACQKFNHHLVHISSGCIFDGMNEDRDFSEEDVPTPACWYAETKSIADSKILDLNYDKVTIIRPRQLISARANPTNMITKFLEIQRGNFIDSKNSLTCIEDMKEMINHLIVNTKYGIFNLANEGTISPYQIASRIKETLKPSMEIEKILYDDYLKLIKVKRVNTILNIDKLKMTGYKPRTALSALEWCLDNYEPLK